MSSGPRVRQAVSRLFDEAASTGPVSVDSALAAAERLRGRTIVVDHRADLPDGVCGRWVVLRENDVVQTRVGSATNDWTTLHELGHMLLGHSGRPATELAAEAVAVADTAIIEYMLTRGETPVSDEERRQEDEAESFARLMSARMADAAGSASPSLSARLDETLS